MKPKPIEYDVHLKYLCSNCGQAHWLSIDEAKTSGFKVVCFCKNTFSVKKVKDIKILYQKKKTAPISTPPVESVKEYPKINKQLLDRASSIMVGYGFTKKEAIESIEKTYNSEQIKDHLELVKKTLASMRT
jgi:hypothetical protein